MAPRLPRRRLRQSLQFSGKPAKRSRLGDRLLSDWAWGDMSAIHVQALAAAAKADGILHPSLQRMSALGNSGHCPQNCHREMINFCKGVSSFVEPYMLPFRAVNLQLGSSVEVELPVFLPHEIFAHLHYCHPERFDQIYVVMAVEVHSNSFGRVLGTDATPAFVSTA